MKDHLKIERKDVKIGLFPEGDEPKNYWCSGSLLANGLQTNLTWDKTKLTKWQMLIRFNISHLEIIDPQTYADDKYAEKW